MASNPAFKKLGTPKRLIMAIDNDNTLREAAQRLNVYPKKLYTMVQQSNWFRVKQTADFVMSVLTHFPAYFYCDENDENYTTDPLVVQERARKLFIELGSDINRPIFDNVAGPDYYAKWGRKEDRA